MTCSGDQPLAGRRVVVTRATDQAGALVSRLAALGAEVLEVPTIAIADPVDGGQALVDAVGSLRAGDWVVVTSPNGAQRLAAAAGRRGLAEGTRLAVVGPGTADACSHLGLAVDLVPTERFVGEGLVDAFPEGPGRVVVAQAAGARPAVVDGLRAKGWTVEPVVAYRTEAASVPASVVTAAADADAVTFASASAVTAYLAAGGRRAVPATVVCIGPVTAAAAEDAGLTVAAVATEHTVSGLVEAVVGALR